MHPSVSEFEWLQHSRPSCVEVLSYRHWTPHSFVSGVAVFSSWYTTLGGIHGCKMSESDILLPPSDVSDIMSRFDDEFEYRMPAEWDKHSACLILFPHNEDTFRVPKAAEEIIQLALDISTVGKEAVYLLCKDPDHAEAAKTKIREIVHETNHFVDPLFPICVGVCPSNDTWARDTAPTFVEVASKEDEGRTRMIIGLDWNFNAYGGPEEGCYWPCADDRKIAGRICSGTVLAEPLSTSTTQLLPVSETLSIHSSLSVPIILEGGSIHTDGDGTLITTSECLLNPNRNPHLTQDHIEVVLRRALGVSKILWLPFGLDVDDDTNGHVDNFCCFVGPGHVVLAWTDVRDREDSDDDDNDDTIDNYRRCRIAEQYLLSQTDAKGRPIQITKLFLPSIPLTYTEEEAATIGSSKTNSSALIRKEGEIMAASYVNYYVANKAVLVPQFAAKDESESLLLLQADRAALETLRPLFPGRTIVGVPSREILLGGGNIHCQTQQVPLSTLENLSK